MKKIFETLKQKWPEYLLEIFVITLGILGAFALNNWNELRTESSQELKLLKTLKLDLDENTRRLKQMISSDSILLERNRIVVQLLKDDRSLFHDSLRVYFGNINTYYAFFPQVMAYESLKSEGVNLIKNDSLRFSIIKLFDDDYNINTHATETKKDMAINSNSFLAKHIEMLTLSNGWMGGIPNDYESLKGNSEFINIISQISSAKYIFLSYSRSIYENTKTTRKLLTSEIQKFENK
jgi:Family of unknown function (DUF6090)